MKNIKEHVRKTCELWVHLPTLVTFKPSSYTFICCSSHDND